MSIYRRTVAVLSVILLSSVLFGCGDTWRGFKKDTGENLQKAGETIEKTGEKVKN